MLLVREGNWVSATWAYHLILVCLVLWMRKE